MNEVIRDTVLNWKFIVSLPVLIPLGILALLLNIVMAGAYKISRIIDVVGEQVESFFKWLFTKVLNIDRLLNWIFQDRDERLKKQMIDDL